MKVKTGAGGVATVNAPQQQWHGDEIMQTALFAGQRMIAITDDDDGFILIYLDFESDKFTTIEQAKENAPVFYQAVLQHMGSLVQYELKL